MGDAASFAGIELCGGVESAMLDPQAQRFLAALKAAGRPPLSSVTPAAARGMLSALVAKLAGPKVDLHDVGERDIPGPRGPIPARVYTPFPGDGMPVFVYFHGGGYVIGDLEMADEACRRIARDARCIVVSVDYRLAPEFPYPGPIDDAFAATRWVAEHAVEFGGDPARVAVGGDSAGGGLAAVVALMARDRGGPRLALQVLVYPAVDDSNAYASLQEFGNDYYLTLDSMDWFHRQHVPAGTDAGDPYLWVMRAKDLRGVAPALVITAEADPIRDAAEAYARRLEADGVPVTLTRYDGMLHGFFLYPSYYAAAADAEAEAAAALRDAFAAPVQIGETASAAGR